LAVGVAIPLICPATAWGNRTDSESMNKSDWKIIFASLKQGSCVALVGPYLSTTVAGGEPLNLAKTLSRHLAEELSEDDAGKKIEVQDPDDFPLVAQSYSDSYSREVILPQEFGHGVKLLSQIASEYYCQ
jgi:hypothetical protein